VHTLLALHGQTLNGTLMRGQLAHLDKLGVQLVCPDGPLECSDRTVEYLYSVWDAPRQPPPHRAWWDASDDGRTYRGWEATRDLVVPILERGPVGIIGFSQGAILATALAAMAQHGQLPPIDYVILIAGRTPRADVFAPFLVEPIRTRSLHIWGETDRLVGTTSRDLVDLFDATTRHVVTWPGSHHMPTDGAAAQAIERFITQA
jgi:pimeloyl-ACP methyl ester carboxylesterase